MEKPTRFEYAKSFKYHHVLYTLLKLATHPDDWFEAIIMPFGVISFVFFYVIGFFLMCVPIRLILATLTFNRRKAAYLRRKINGET